MLCKSSAFNRKRTLSKVDCFLLTLFQGGWFCHPLIAFVFLSFRHLFSFFWGDAAGRWVVGLRCIYRHAFLLVGFPWSICVCVSLIDYSVQHSCGGGIPHVVAAARIAHVWSECPATQKMNHSSSSGVRKLKTQLIQQNAGGNTLTENEESFAYNLFSKS